MLKDRLIQFACTLTILILQAALWPLVLKMKDLPPEVIFWYAQPAAQRLAPLSFLWLLPGLAVGLWIINLVIAQRLYRRFPSTSQILALSGIVFATLASVSVIKIILTYTTLP